MVVAERHARLALTVIALLCVPAIGCTEQISNAAALEHARKLLGATPLIDGHNDLPWLIREETGGDVEAFALETENEFDTDIPKLREGLVGAQFWSVWIPGETPLADAASMQLEQIDVVHQMLAKHSVRYMTLTHNVSTWSISRIRPRPRCTRPWTSIPSFLSQAVWEMEEQLWATDAAVETVAALRKTWLDYDAEHGAIRASVDDVANHIEHIRDVAGIDHVGLGSDYWGMPDMPTGLEDVSKYPNLFAELIVRGWSDTDLRKLAGGNLLRVMREVEAVAQTLQRDTRPSNVTMADFE